ncbi:hypothetical protein HHX47_DHR7000406, partial [Lentinula edodes]
NSGFKLFINFCKFFCGRRRHCERKQTVRAHYRIDAFGPSRCEDPLSLPFHHFGRCLFASSIKQTKGTQAERSNFA